VIGGEIASETLKSPNQTKRINKALKNEGTLSETEGRMLRKRRSQSGASRFGDREPF